MASPENGHRGGHSHIFSLDLKSLLRRTQETGVFHFRVMFTSKKDHVCSLMKVNNIHLIKATNMKTDLMPIKSCRPILAAVTL